MFSCNKCYNGNIIKASQEILDNIEAGVIQTQITDHYTLIMTMPKYNNNKIENSVYRLINYEVLRENLKEMKWDDMYSNMKIDECVDLFYEKNIKFS